MYLADTPVTALREVEAIIQTAAGLLGIKGPPRILLQTMWAFLSSCSFREMSPLAPGLMAKIG